MRWHFFAENLLQGRLTQKPWVYVRSTVFCWTRYCSKILHFLQKYSLCPYVVRALLYGCGGSEGNLHYRTEREGSYCYLTIPLLDSDELSPPIKGVKGSD